MPDIDELGLPEEAVPEIDWEAPEAGAFPPEIYPGVYEFLFCLPEETSEQFDKVKVDGKDYLQVIYEADVLRDSQAAAIPPHEDGKQPRLAYQRASAYKHPRMSNSMLGDLIRSLDLRIEGPLTPLIIAQTLRGADGRRTFRGDVGWRFYCKTCDITVATHPRRRQGDVAWPRDDVGHFVDVVTCPQCGQKGYGRAEILRFKLPERT